MSCSLATVTDPPTVHTPPRTPTCAACGTDADRARLLSRHQTSDGIVSWLRCPCGALQARMVGHTGSRVVAQGGPASANRAAQP